MNILVIDRDELATQMLESKLTAMGHTVETESSKNDAVDKIAQFKHDIIFMDPAPLTSARPVTLNIRRSASHYPYIFLMSENGRREDAIKDGANDMLGKPIDNSAVEQKMINAERMITLVKRIGDTSEDFPSAGGVIAKSAFNQLFLSAIDRADRYGERTYVLFIGIDNYNEILEMDGPYAADYAAAKLSQVLVKIRRQSDIISQTAKHEYALLLQRPLYETEPMEAANRFAESLSKQEDFSPSGNIDIKISVLLMDLPVGSDVVHHIVGPQKTSD